MLDSLKSQLRSLPKIAIALTPWLIAMYVFYWLDSSGTWTSETPHRGKISVLILGTGMGLSFLVQSHFLTRKQKEKKSHAS